MKPEKSYRPNVGLIVFNRKGEVLVGERLGVPDSWQFPQGGIDDGEDPQVAALRELYEEVGINDAVLAYVHPEWLYYDFPPTLKLTGKWANYCGQRQQWYAFYWDHPATDCQLDIHDREFRVVQFMAIEQTLDSIVRFKREVYQQVVKIFTPVIRDYIGKLH